VSEDKENAGEGERNQRERDKQKGAKATLQEGPAVYGKFVGAAYAFHESGEDAGGSEEADDERDDKGARGFGAVRGVDEVALQERTDIRRKDSIEEG
jgi:hypothetical protein